MPASWGYKGSGREDELTRVVCSEQCGRQNSPDRGETGAQNVETAELAFALGSAGLQGPHS